MKRIIRATSIIDDDELADIITELEEDGFDITDPDDIMMGLCADLGFDRDDARDIRDAILHSCG